MPRRLKVSRRGALKVAGAGLTGMAALSVAAKVPAGALRVERLRVEWREAPVGIDTLGPLFTWKSVARDERAWARTIRMARSCDAQPRRACRRPWGGVDSGRIAGSHPAAWPHGPLALASHRAHFWSVEIWDQADQSSDQSAPACFTR